MEISNFFFCILRYNARRLKSADLYNKVFYQKFHNDSHDDRHFSPIVFQLFDLCCPLASKICNSKRAKPAVSRTHENCVRKCISEENFSHSVATKSRLAAQVWIFISRLHHAQCAIYAVIKMPFCYSLSGAPRALQVKRKIGFGLETIEVIDSCND